MPNNKKQRGRDNQKKKEAQNGAQQIAAVVRAEKEATARHTQAQQKAVVDQNVARLLKAQLRADLERKFGTPAVETVIQDMAAAAAAAAAASQSSSYSSTEQDEVAVCYHGSSAEHVVAGSAFLKVVKSYVVLCKKYEGGDLDQYQDALDKFYRVRENKEIMYNVEFPNFVFALGVSLYLKLPSADKENYRKLQMSKIDPWGEVKQTASYELQNILKLGLSIKYYMSPPTKGEKIDYEQFCKYRRNVNSERGIINCLYRETKKHCGCMVTDKGRANNMEKMDLCHGCRIVFPKAKTKLCDGCTEVVYCSTKCSVDAWPRHKPYCTNAQGRINDEKTKKKKKKKKKRAATTGTATSNANGSMSTPVVVVAVAVSSNRSTATSNSATIVLDEGMEALSLATNTAINTATATATSIINATATEKETLDEEKTKKTVATTGTTAASNFDGSMTTPVAAAATGTGRVRGTQTTP